MTNKGRAGSAARCGPATGPDQGSRPARHGRSACPTASGCCEAAERAGRCLGDGRRRPSSAGFGPASGSGFSTGPQSVARRRQGRGCSRRNLHQGAPQGGHLRPERLGHGVVPDQPPLPAHRCKKAVVVGPPPAFARFSTIPPARRMHRPDDLKMPRQDGQPADQPVARTRDTIPAMKADPLEKALSLPKTYPAPSVQPGKSPALRPPASSLRLHPHAPPPDAADGNAATGRRLIACGRAGHKTSTPDDASARSCSRPSLPQKLIDLTPPWSTRRDRPESDRPLPGRRCGHDRTAYGTSCRPAASKGCA